MRTGILGSVSALLAAAPFSLADPPRTVPVAPPALSFDLPDAPLPGQLPPSVETAPAPPREGGTPAEPIAPPARQEARPPAAQQPACGSCAQPPATPAWHDYHVGPHEQLWLGGGYRTGWIKDGPFPAPLVTTGPAAAGGTFNAPGSAVLFGGGDVEYDTFQGFDVHGGVWLNCRHTFGVEAGGFFLGRQSISQTFASDATGNPLIARPVIDALAVRPLGVLVSQPGVLAGAVNVNSSSRLDGAEANFVMNILHCDDRTIDSYFGFRYIDLDESLTVTQSTRPLGGGTLAFNGGQLPAGVGVTLFDSFRTHNQFYGGQVGTRGEWRFGPWFVGGTTSIALGPNREVLEIDGRTTAGNGASQVGGLLAVGGGNEVVLGANGSPTAFRPAGNIGRVTTSRFIYAPEGGVQVGAYVSSHLKLSIGYNFLYMSDVLRPGQQVDLAVNGRFVPTSTSFGSVSGQSAPRVTGQRDDFYAHMFQFGAEVRY